VGLLNKYRTPAEALRALLDQYGWSQEQLAIITGRSRQTIAQILAGNSGISAEMAVVLGAAFAIEAGEWLELEARYRLSQVGTGGGDVEKRAKLYGRIPIKDAQRRGWIKDTAEIDELEADIKRFLRIDSLDEEPDFIVATRRPGESGAPLNPAQLAWCARARELAELVQVAPYRADDVDKIERDLRTFAAYPKEARLVSKTLAERGIRFVVVEALPAAKIDGAAFWLDAQSPVIAVSIRYDRVDCFWFTLMHEWWHIRNGDGLSVDTELVDPARAPASINEMEDRANREAAARLIPPDELESFIRRVSPLYSRARIVQLAHKLKVHPGIIVGQLQHRGEVGFSSLRDLLAKVRESVIATALTDGWGAMVPMLPE
jgi:HTH-type transcriptional regulator/antitoxin HigA